MSKSKLLWSSRTGNRKTGDVPTAWVGPADPTGIPGQDIEATRETCKGCPLLAERTCYAHIGSPRIGVTAVFKGAKRFPERYTLKRALVDAHRSARFVRMTAIGDLARVERTSVLSDIRTARQAGFGVLAYTHFWRAEPRTGALKREVLASCNNPGEADEAKRAGWVPAAIIPEAPAGPIYTTAEGTRLVVCPAQRRNGAVQCNDCGLCDRQSPAWRSGKVDGVAFIPHGIGEKRLAETTKRATGKRLPVA